MRNHTIYIEAQNFTEYSINSNCKSQVQACVCNFPPIFSTCLLQEDYDIQVQVQVHQDAVFSFSGSNW